MTYQEFRSIIAQRAAEYRAKGNHDKAARIELAGEYVTNAQFRKALQDYVWRINNP